MSFGNRDFSATVSTAMYSLGIEEEFFLFDVRTRRAVRRVDRKFMKAAKAALGDRVTAEMLQSQIEIVTPPCQSTAQAREHLVAYRRALGDAASAHSLGLAAMGSFPLAFWPEQSMTPKARYGAIMDDLQMIGYRNMLCGMHVHVAVPDVDHRINLIMRLTPYLPLLLALSTSSPFWQGHLTGLVGYRLAAYDELPRTGLPELFRTNEDYREYVDTLVGANIIPDASYIWWAMRPSVSYPTIELRVADSCTRVDDAIAIAALFRCLVRALDRNRGINAGFDRVGRAISKENKWHAQRYGIAAKFVDPFSHRPMNARSWLGQVRAFIAEDVAYFGCTAEIARIDGILDEGTSAHRQIEVYTRAKAAGRRRLTAMKDVVDWVAAETLAATYAVEGINRARASPIRRRNL